MSRAVLLTGGNLGDTEANLAAARHAIGRRVGRVVAVSSVRESEPWGFEARQNFMNQVLVVETLLSPQQLLGVTQAIEQRLGRIRNSQQGYASRTMDIDILYYDNRIIDLPWLSVPHPRIAQREFTLALLAEIMPLRRDPRTGKTITRMLHEAVTPITDRI